MGKARRKPLFMVAMDAARGRKELTPAGRLLLGYLAVKQGRNGESWPGERTIAADLGLSRQTVIDSAARLCAAGLIEKTPGRPGRGHSHRYRVHLDKRSREQTFSDDTKGPESRPFADDKRSNPHKKKVQRVDQRRSRDNHHTSSSKRTAGQPKGKGRRRAKARRVEYTPEYERFWTIYPRKEKKLAAFEAWTALAPDADLVETIIASVRQHIQSEQWSRSLAEDGGKFVPLATTFLNQRRWEDTPVTRPVPEDADFAPFGTHRATEEEIQALEEAGAL